MKQERQILGRAQGMQGDCTKINLYGLLVLEPPKENMFID